MMAPVTSTSTVVKTLTEVDPQFVQLVEMLYGDAVDPYIAMSEFVSKAQPSQTDLARQKSERTQARVGLASNALGLAAGGAALGEVARRPAFAEGGKISRGISRAGHGAGRLVPAAAARGLAAAGPKRLAVGALGLQAANVGGDVVANRVLARSAKKEPVGKAAPPIGDLVAGIRGKLVSATQRLTPPKPTVTPKVTPVPGAAAPSQAQQFGRGVGLAATSTPGKVLIGTGAVAGGAKVAANRRQSGQLVPQQQAVGLVDPLSQQPVTKAADIEWSGTFSKFDDDKHLAFGWASVIKLNGLPVVDQQSDMIDESELEDAAYKYVLESRKGGHMHRRDELDEPVHVSDIVESMVFTDEKIAKMGLPDNFPRGWWIGTKIHDPEVWSEVKKGNLGGFSIHGKGKRQVVPMDSAMGW